MSKKVWELHQHELHGDLFFTWQYDLHMAAETLRRKRRLQPVQGRHDQPWTLADPDRQPSLF